MAAILSRPQMCAKWHDLWIWHGKQMPSTLHPENSFQDLPRHIIDLEIKPGDCNDAYSGNTFVVRNSSNAVLIRTRYNL